MFTRTRVPRSRPSRAAARSAIPLGAGPAGALALTVERFATMVLTSFAAGALLLAAIGLYGVIAFTVMTRTREIGVRLALGASRGQIVRQLLVESLLLGGAGGAAGLLLATWTSQLLVSLMPAGDAPPPITTTPDMRILLFALAVSMATALLFGMAPAMQSIRVRLAPTLKDQAGSIAGGHFRVRKVLVALQVFLSLVLLIGAGGLGCPAALYLTAAGIGRLTLADSDKVDLTNLQRQILYRAESVGAVKVEAARAALHALNPEVQVVSLHKRLGAEDFRSLVSETDIVLDCSDNFATRHALNRACVKHKKPLVSGAAIQFDAQLMVFDLSNPVSPCYACLFPEDAQVEEVQCSTMGVFAPITGVVGAMQAMEALKLVAGIGSPAHLQILDARNAEWRSVRVKKDPACAVCA